MKCWIGLSLLSVLFWVGGCSSDEGGEGNTAVVDPASARSGVAILDLVALARSLGRDQQMQAAYVRRRAGLDKSYKELASKIGPEFEKKKKAYGTTPTDAQKKELSELIAPLRKMATEIKQNLKAFNNKLLNDWQGEVRPLALNVAHKRGAAVVLLHDANRQAGQIFAFDDAINITKEVQFAMMHAGIDVNGVSSPSVPKPKVPVIPEVPEFKLPQIPNFEPESTPSPKSDGAKSK
jgi:hypothetical protein